MPVTRSFEVLDLALEQHPLTEFIGTRGPDGQWSYQSTEGFKQQVDALARGLIGLNLPAGSKVAVAAYKNRPEWVAVDLACAQAGIISVPVYPTISANDYTYIFKQSEVEFAFVGGGDLYEKVEEATRDLPDFQQTFVFDEAPGKPHWTEAMDAAPGSGQRPDPELVAKLAGRREAIGSEDLVTIIYTSGTTGLPKGVMLTHTNFCSAIEAAAERLAAGPGDTVLSFLPLCHVFERMASHVFIYNGCQIALAGTDNLGGPDGDLRAVRPHFFTTVPRLLEKVYEKIYAKGEELTGLKKKLFFWALAMTDAYDYQHPLTGFSASVADRLIFSKWREALGGRIKGILTGAAPCPTHILRVFSAAGIPVREAYGLTETSPGLTINEFNRSGALLGTVGPAVLDVELRIEEDAAYGEGEGEILAHGPNVMRGYYENPEATESVFTEIDGRRWFRTGDIGTFVEGPGGRQFLKITDRKKELLKTSGGKYVAPAPIESRLKESPLVEHVMVVGDQKKFVSALIVPSAENLPAWCRERGVQFADLTQACKEPEVVAAFDELVGRVNGDVSHTEQIKKFVLLPGPWEVTHPDGSDGELTPTMKLKRRVVRERYAEQIDGLYV